MKHYSYETIKITDGKHIIPNQFLSGENTLFSARQKKKKEKIEYIRMGQPLIHRR